MILAIDFDGTCVEHMYPAVGPDVPGAAEKLSAFVDAGHQLILWTIRSEQQLHDAVNWFAEHSLPLLGVNENPTQKSWSSSPKAYAQIYIDDAAYNAPLRPGIVGERSMFDWRCVEIE